MAVRQFREAPPFQANLTFVGRDGGGKFEVAF